MYLFSKGYSSFVFDYTGFGNSTGQPTVSNLNNDAIEAYKKFASLTPNAKERIGFAHSLGCSILLNDANDFKPLLNKVVIHGAFSTLRNILVEKHFINDSSKTNYPNVWNGLKNAQKIKSSLYVLHSVNDKTIPIAMSMELAKSAGSNGRFLKLETPGHNAVYELPNDKTWNAIFEFIK
jgi:pimeloyl-ACP methyl ester carboxylesterase